MAGWVDWEFLWVCAQTPPLRGNTVFCPGCCRVHRILDVVLLLFCVPFAHKCLGKANRVSKDRRAVVRRGSALETPLMMPQMLFLV